jgi:hypothetical protein
MKFEMVISARDGSRAELLLDANVLRVYDYSSRQLYSINGNNSGTKEKQIFEVGVESNENWRAIASFLESQNWHEYYDQPNQSYLASWGLIYENGAFKIVAGGQSSYPTGFKKLIRLINDLIAESKFKLQI